MNCLVVAGLLPGTEAISMESKGHSIFYLFRGVIPVGYWYSLRNKKCAVCLCFFLFVYLCVSLPMVRASSTGWNVEEIQIFHMQKVVLKSSFIFFSFRRVDEIAIISVGVWGY